MIASHLMTGGAGLGVGFMVIWSAVSPPPPIDLQSVLYDVESGIVTYQRVVNSRSIIRAPYVNEVVEMETELSVPECSREGWADFGPEEREVQTWPIGVFSGAECQGALVAGRVYTIVATVNPISGEGSQARSDPFTVPEPEQE